MGWAGSDNLPQPVAIDAAARQVFREAGRGALVTPVWSTTRKRSAGPALFYAVPFSMDWSDAARSAVRATCKEAGICYWDGETAEDVRILQRIWDSIVSADWVLADMTNLNPNVMMELGMAHTLGRPALVVQQIRAERESSRVRNLEKIEVRR